MIRLYFTRGNGPYNAGDRAVFGGPGTTRDDESDAAGRALVAAGLAVEEQDAIPTENPAAPVEEEQP